jgi:8-oxo-dGTP pyrophosphatase MutT (NUDIX family)
VSPFRPDLVDVWVFRSAAARGVEILLMRRSAGRILSGLWQGVSGSLEPGERIVAGALRELREETGIEAEGIAALYDLDQVNQFHEPSVDGIVSAAVFAVRVRPGVEPELSHEHDTARWVTPAEALDLVVWPAYRVSIARIAGDLLDAERAAWFELDGAGHRKAR